MDKELFPKLFAGEFGAEISTLLTSKSQALHSSFWDGDLEGFIYQSEARGLSKRMPLVGTTAEASIWRLRDKMPDGTIIGGRGPNGPLAPKSATAIPTTVAMALAVGLPALAAMSSTALALLRSRTE